MDKDIQNEFRLESTSLGKAYMRPVGTAGDGSTVWFVPSIPYAHPERFEFPQMIGEYPANRPINRPGTVCFPQPRRNLAINVMLKHHMMRREWMAFDDEQTEDANVANVWTPDLAGSLPVLVFIHGGNEGSGTVPLYDGAHLAEAGIVVVTITYRIGPFGYLPTVDEEGRLVANLSGRDHREALRWVRANTAAFGGDPQRVTLMGHSGGSLACLDQMLSPGSAGLFDRLILCGGSLPTAIPAAEAQSGYQRMLKANGLSGVEELRGLPVKRLLKLKTADALGEVVDGSFFPDDPKRALDEGCHPHVPVLVGSNADEFSMIEMPMFYRAMGIASKERGLDEALRGSYGTLADVIRAELEPESNGVVDLQVRALELNVFHATALTLMRCFSRSCPVYGYRFGFVPNLYGGLRGAYHGAEVAMFFGNLDKMGIPITEENREAMRLVRADWLAFVRDGAIPGRHTFDARELVTLYQQDAQGVSVETVEFPHKALIDRCLEAGLYEKVRSTYMRAR